MSDEIDLYNAVRNAERTAIETAFNVEGVNSANNAPKDAQKLENIAKAPPYSLYYPLNLQDSTVNASSFNHAVSFVIYTQHRSVLTDPFAGGNRSQLARGFNQRQFPASAEGFLVSTGIRTVATLPRFSDRPVELAYLGAKAGLGAVAGNRLTNIQPGYGLNQRLNKTEQIITLYTPDTMAIEETHQYEQISLSSAAGMAGLLSFGSEFGANLTEFTAEFASRTGIIGPRAAEAAVSGLGYAINPNLELIFNGTMQRKFRFQFRFAPRNKKEAEAALNIIKAFRFHAAAEFETGSSLSARYFIPPSTFEIQYKHRLDGKLVDNVNLPRTAPCVLTSVDTNYAASGNYVAFQDGVPSEITLDLAFTETTVLVKDDIRNGY